MLVGQLHVMVADVFESFDTVDSSILDCAPGRLGLPAWFRKVYFAYHDQVRSGSNWRRVQASLGVVMGYSPGLPAEHGFSLLPCVFFGVGIWRPSLLLSPSFTLITSSVLMSVPMPSLELLGSQPA